jgi:AraC family transcriptional regulator
MEVTAPPRRFLSSAASGWDGAFLAEVTTAPAGEIHQDHQVLVLERWLTPLRTRPTSGPGGWTTHAPGAWLRLPGEGDHAEWRGSTPWQFLFVSPGRIETVLGAPWQRSGLTRWSNEAVDLPFVEAVLAAMAQDRADGFPSGPLAGEALVIALLAHLSGRPTGRPLPHALGRRLAVVLEYIEANLGRPLRLVELANLAGVGVRRFGSMFLADTGWTPHRYVLNRKLERAKTLMRDPKLTLRQIARAIGFANQAQLSRAFRQYVGESPRAYRRR